MAKFGFSSLNQNLNASQQNSFLGDIDSLKSKIVMGRVSSINLTNNTDNTLGQITFNLVNNPQSHTFVEEELTASPLFPNIKNYPLLNEVVLIIEFISPDSQENSFESVYYYMCPGSIWNHPHLNALPNSIETPTDNVQQTSYQESEAGFNQAGTPNEEYSFGVNFEENSQIQPLLPYEGDVIVEGRFGQGLRFGSTNNKSSSQNQWSTQGNNGSPITILSNGQPTPNTPGFTPRSENINDIPSSIYLTNGQNIPLEVSSTTYSSYRTTPTTPNEYSGDQVILSSNRLVFNSKTDHILLSSGKSIGLSSIESVNIDSPITTIDSNSILLGANNANQSVIKGEELMVILKDVLSSLRDMTEIMQTDLNKPAGPYAPTATNALLLNIKLRGIEGRLDRTLSQITKTL